VHINTVKALADQLRSIEVNMADEDVYMASWAFLTNSDIKYMKCSPKFWGALLVDKSNGFANHV
jgi:hypothetical protein